LRNPDVRKKPSRPRSATAIALAAIAVIAIALSIASCGAKSRAASESGKDKGPARAAAFKALPAAELATLMSSLGITAAPGRPEVPEIELVSLDGKKSKLSDYRGKAVLLNFWATWCPPCRAEMPSLERMRKILLDEGRAFDIVAIDVAEDPSTVKKFLFENEYTFPVFLDESGAVSVGFASQGIPTTIIVDKAGKAAGFIVGSREWDEAGSLDLFRSLAAE
jgi:thiol-disulfide isomerase/thioredoxin